MDDNKKQELLQKVKELAKGEDISKAYYEIKSLGKNFRDHDDTSLFEQELIDEYEATLAEVVAKMGDVKESIKNKKEEIIASAEKILQNNDFKSNKMKQLMDEWKTLGHLDKEADDELWNKFNEVKNKFYENKQAYYEQLKAKFEANKQNKIELIAKAKEALNLEDVPSANKLMKDLMDEWKKIGNAGKEAEEGLWQEFSSLRKEFFKKRDSYYEQMKEVYANRVSKKEEIIAKAKINLARSEFTDDEIKQMNELKAEWKKIGFAGKDQENELWDKFSGILNKYNENMKYYK